MLYHILRLLHLIFDGMFRIIKGDNSKMPTKRDNSFLSQTGGTYQF